MKRINGKPTGNLATAAVDGDSEDLLNRARRPVGMQTQSSIGSRTWMIPLSVLSMLLVVAWTLAGCNTAVSEVNWKDLKTSDFPSATGEQVIAFHTDEKIIVVVVAKPPTSWTSMAMDAHGDATRLAAQFSWDEKKLIAVFRRQHTDQVVVNGETINLDAGRIVYWNSEDDSISQSPTLRLSPIQFKDDANLSYLPELKNLLTRINRDFASAKAGTDDNQLDHP